MAAGTQVRPRFEVTSVKPSGDDQSGAPRETPTGVSYQGVPLVWLISRTYGIGQREILGGPEWIRTRRFHVNAATGRELQSRAELTPMLQALLEDRFGLLVQRAEEERPVYALVVGRNDKRLGPNLKPATSSCAVPGEFPSSTLEYKTNAAGREVLAITRCGLTYAGSGGQAGSGLLAVFASRVTMAQFVSMLTRVLDRPVIDRTGLDAEYDFRVLTSEVLSVSADDLGGNQRFLVAIEDQLGLKLEPAWARIDVLRIQSVEPPTEN